MYKTTFFSLMIALLSMYFAAPINAEGFIKKEVYSFKDKNGNIVFTDKQPAQAKTFKTQTIEAANSTGDTQYTYQSSHKSNEQNDQTDSSYHSQNNEQVVRVIVEDGQTFSKKSYKKKRSLKRCKSFKKKFDYYSEKMNEGYKSSEYKKLEKNRKKYRNLLFKHCDTRIFAD